MARRGIGESDPLVPERFAHTKEAQVEREGLRYNRYA